MTARGHTRNYTILTDAIDGSGVCLYSKTLEENSFCWPGISAARVRLDHSQLMALLAGMDWKKIRPAKVRRPLLTG